MQRTIKKKEKKTFKQKAKYVKDEFKKEFLFNIPTFLNALRIFLALVVIYMILTNRNIILIVVIFSIAAITDWFDGKIARKYQLVNPFGAKADMFADRVLWVSVAVCILIVFGLRGMLDISHAIQLTFLMIREIITAPTTISYFIFGERIFPKARYIAKATTFLQGFAFPTLMLSLYYPFWNYISWPLSIAALITGLISAAFYIRDLGKLNSQNIRKNER